MPFERFQPKFRLDPQDDDFGVRPGSIKYGYGDGDAIVDYSEQRPTMTTPRGEIPPSLQGRSYLRPLMQGNSDGSPMSLADMESRSNAMDALDSFFDLQPSAKAAELARLEAETAKSEAAAEDPLYLERGKVDFEMAKRAFELEQKERLARETEAGRRDEFGGELEELNAATQEALRRAAGDQNKIDTINERHAQHLQSIRDKHGIGAKLGASSLYRTDPSGY